MYICRFVLLVDFRRELVEVSMENVDSFWDQRIFDMPHDTTLQQQ